MLSALAVVGNDDTDVTATNCAGASSTTSVQLNDNGAYGRSLDDHSGEYRITYTGQNGYAYYKAYAGGKDTGYERTGQTSDHAQSHRSLINRRTLGPPAPSGPVRLCLKGRSRDETSGECETFRNTG